MEQFTLLNLMPSRFVFFSYYYCVCCLFLKRVFFFIICFYLQGSLVETLREVRPTTFFGVPRVWEKIHEKMLQVGKTTRGVKKTIANWSKSVGLTYNRRRMEGRTSKPFGYSLANSLVFKKVREGLGLDKARLVLSGAAPLSKEVNEYFLSLDIPILEVLYCCSHFP